MRTATIVPTRWALWIVIPQSIGYGRLVGQLDMPNVGDELHHFGWNACSASLCPYAPHPHMERRYLIVPGINSSRIHIVDTKPDPKKAADRQSDRTGNAGRPHRLRVAAHASIAARKESTPARSAPPGGDGPGGIFVIDHDSFDILGKWELDRGPQYLAYDFWWHLGLDTVITSEWGTPNMVQHGHQSRDSAEGRLRAQAARLGSSQAPSFAGTRSGRRISDGARAASRARSHARLRIPGRRGFAQGSVRIHLGLASRRDAQMGREENHRNSRRAGRSGETAAAAARASKQCRR